MHTVRSLPQPFILFLYGWLAGEQFQSLVWLADLRFAGLQNPLDAPHHVRRSEWLPYREGVVVATAGSAKKARGEALSAGEKKKLEKDGGAWVDCGLPRKVWVSEKKLADNMR